MQVILDEKDRMILNFLAENARMSYTEIGKKLGISRVAAMKRVTNLENNGFIRGYHADISINGNEPETLFHLEVKLTPSNTNNINSIADFFKELDYVQKVYIRTGGKKLLVEGRTTDTTATREELGAVYDQFSNIEKIYFYSFETVVKQHGGVRLGKNETGDAHN